MATNDSEPAKDNPCLNDRLLGTQRQTSKQSQTGLQTKVVSTWPLNNQEILPLLNSSGLHYEQGNFTTALAELHEAERTAPDCSLIYAAEYQVLSALKRDDEAITACRKWRQLEPNNPFAWKSSAEFYGIKGDWVRCLDASERGITLSPRVSEDCRAFILTACNLSKAFALAQLHRPKESAQSLEYAEKNLARLRSMPTFLKYDRDIARIGKLMTLIRRDVIEGRTGR